MRVWQGTLTLPTYEEGAPDPNPPFDQYANGRFNYPYTLRDTLTNRRTDHAWRAVFLENEYLKCSVLPDLGGHIYTCVDKINGQPMFYANPSIKKADISYRGAWAAFGVEFNFPVSHNWVSLSPVDFGFGKKDDGSGFVLVGNVDRVYGMQWTVEIVMRPGTTVLEQKVTLNNRSDVRHRFYWWNNAGVQAWDDSIVQYPMRFVASHGFRDVQPWPVDADGNDLSVIKNQTKGPVSSFVHGSREPFMAVWHPHTNAGTAHYAEYPQLPAKKIWSWGTDPDGLDWRKTLSDNDSAYVEVQAGLFRNQETYAFLEPRQSIHFSEFWMPVRDIGGISRANLAGVVHLSREHGALIVGLNVNEAVRGGTLRILQGEQEILHQAADLNPQQTWKHELAKADSHKKYTFELRSKEGTVLLRQTEGEYDWTPLDQIHVGPQTSYHMPDREHRSEDDWLQLGKGQELDGYVLAALKTYKDGLGKFPESFALRKAAGRLCAGLLRFEETKNYLEPVFERNTSDTEISYYLGIAYDGIGQEREAREAFEAAARMPAFRSGGNLRLAELSAREGNLTQAEAYLQLAGSAAPDDLRTGEELTTVLRAAGKNTEAQTLAKQWLSRFPNNYFLHDELGTPDLHHLADDAERALNVAGEYMRLGMYGRALEVLSRSYPSAVADESEPGQLPPDKHPMIAYYRGFCREKLGQSGADEFKNAAKLTMAYVFPSRAQDLEVLAAALKANPDDASAHYLLGTLFFSKALTDRALTEWEQARKLNPQTPVLHASLGRSLLQVEKKPEQALSVFEEGLRADPRNLQLYFGMDQALSLLYRAPEERVAAIEHYPDLANMPTPLVYELILNLTESGQFDRAASLFQNRFFQRAEGGTNVRQVWLELQIQRSLKLAQQGGCSEAIKVVEHLPDPVPNLSFTNDGLEPFLRSARFTYLVGTVYKVCHVEDKAQQKFAEVAQHENTDDMFWFLKASRELPTGNQSALDENIREARAAMDSVGNEDAPTGVWLYRAGLLDSAMGNSQRADSEFREVLLRPDLSMLYHLTRLAMSGQP